MADAITEATPQAVLPTEAQEVEVANDWPEPEPATPATPTTTTEGTGTKTAAPSASTESIKDTGVKTPKTPRTKAKGDKKDKEKEKRSPGSAVVESQSALGDDANVNANANATPSPTPTPKVKKEAPYVNPNRVHTGGAQRDKLTEEELKERMERIRLNNEKIKERRAAVQADEKAFEAVNAAQRAKQTRQRRVQDSINADRETNARRKMEKIAGREWDAEKGGGQHEQQQQQQQKHWAENAFDPAGEEWGVAPVADAGATGDVPEVSGEAPPSEGGRARGKGRGGARGERGKGRGRGRGRGGAERDKAPHLRDDEPQPENTVPAEWGPEVDAAIEMTGIAITTNENDVGDDGWGALKDQDDPWSNL